jgi:hypothetical protein
LWVQGEALAAGGDLAGFQAIRVLILFFRVRSQSFLFITKLSEHQADRCQVQKCEGI